MAPDRVRIEDQNPGVEGELGGPLGQEPGGGRGGDAGADRTVLAEEHRPFGDDGQGGLDPQPEGHGRQDRVQKQALPLPGADDRGHRLKRSVAEGGDGDDGTALAVRVEEVEPGVEGRLG